MMKGTKTIKVEIPEIDSLPLDPTQAQQLDVLCQAARAIQSQIKPLEETKKKLTDGDPEHGVLGIKQLASALDLPERVLGTGWDLRQLAPRSTLNVAKLKMELMHQAIRVEAECPQVVDGLLGPQVCSVCHGTGKRVLEGLPAINYLFEGCTDVGSASWAVYARSEKKEES